MGGWADSSAWNASLPPSLLNLSVLETSSDTPSSRKPPWMFPPGTGLPGPFPGFPAWDLVLLTLDSDFSEGHSHAGFISEIPAPPTRGAAELSLTPPGWAHGHLTLPFSHQALSTSFPCSPHPNPWVPLFVPILQTQNLSLKGAKELDLGHTASKWQTRVGLCPQGVPEGADPAPPCFTNCYNPVSLSASMKRPEAFPLEGGVSSGIAASSTFMASSLTVSPPHQP